MLEASLEVRSAVVYASLIVVLVFLPIFFLDGLAGAFFRPLALAYVLAILASLVVALTVTPALSYMLLTGRAGDRPGSAADARWLQGALPAGAAASSSARPICRWWSCSLAFVVTGAAAHAARAGVPAEFQETDFLMHFVEKPGTSVEAMQRVTVQASKELRAIPGVRNFGSHIGRAEVADEVVGPNFTELWISIDPDVDYEATVDKIEEVVDAYPGLYRDVLTYLRERIKEVLTGASASIVVRLYGPDLDELRAKAKEVEAAMAGVPGVINLKVESQVLVAAGRSAAAARRGRDVRADRRATSAGLRRRCSKGRRSARSTKGRRSSTWSSGACRKCGPTWPRSAPCRSTRPPACRCGWATWPTWPSCRRRTRSSAKTPRAGSTSPATCKDRDLGSVAREIEDEGPAAFRSSANTIPNFSANMRPGRNRPAGLWLLGRLGAGRHRAACSTSIFRPGGRRCWSR